MKKLLILPLALFLLSGCETLGLNNGPNLQEQLLITCKGYSATLTSLAGFRQAGKLSENQIQTVDELRPSLNEACSSNVESTSELVTIVESGLLKLLFVEGTVE